MQVQKSAIAAGGEFDFMFTNTEVYKIVHISKTSQDNPNLSNASEAKHHQLRFCITNTTDFLFLIFENDCINFLPVSKDINYLENGLDSMYESSS